MDIYMYLNFVEKKITGACEDQISLTGQVKTYYIHVITYKSKIDYFVEARIPKP